MQLLDKQGFEIVTELRRMAGRLRQKPDKYKLDAFFEKLVCVIEDQQAQINRLEDKLTGGR